MDRWIGKVAIVTGASSGIGASIAESLIKAGVNVVGAARRIKNIEAMANDLAEEKGKLYAIKTDVSKEQDILDLFDWVKQHLGRVDILINNAGVLPEPTKSSLIDGETERWRQAFDVNVLGLCIATREAVRLMRAKNINGHIIHISSITGKQVLPYYGEVINVYPATKYAVQALAESLHQELMVEKRRIKVSVIAPGLVDSEIFYGKTISPKFGEAMKSMTALQPKDIADAVIYVLSTPPDVLVKDLTITPIDA